MNSQTTMSTDATGPEPPLDLQLLALDEADPTTQSDLFLLTPGCGCGCVGCGSVIDILQGIAVSCCCCCCSSCCGPALGR